MKLFTVARSQAAVDLWAALDLVVRRYQIGEAIAQGRNTIASLLISEYVDAAVVR